MQSMALHTPMKAEEQPSALYAYLDQPPPPVALSYMVWCGHILTCAKCQMLLL